MAAHSALAAILEGIVGHCVTRDVRSALVIFEQVEGLGRSVGIVTAGTGSSPPALDDAVFVRLQLSLNVKIVQVIVPIPEVGNTIFALACYEGRIMALETQGELLFSECARISFRIVGGEKQLGLWCSMGSVAIGAVSVRDSGVVLIVKLSEDLMALPAQRGLVAQEQGTEF